MKPLRVTVLAHGHPELAKGGGEQAAYTLFQLLKERPDVEPVFVARAGRPAIGHDGPFGAFRGRSDEILWSPPGLDWFRYVTQHPGELERHLGELVSALRPDVVHAHHYIGFGVDIFRLLSAELGLPVILTLHEFAAICHNHGQMVKHNRQLCYAESYAECSACFPDFSSAKFFLRKELLLENLAHVSRFVAPSAFLAERYHAWGIPVGRITVKENPLARFPQISAAPARQHEQGQALTIGFFGQFSPFKGLDVLFEAAEIVERQRPGLLRVVLFGANLDLWPADFQKSVEDRLARLRQVITFYGPYRNETVIERMRSVDWVVVPSTWWENSPVVIQEARAAGVPVLCSDIGGMREKVRPGLDGLHFMAGNAVDLAEKLVAIAEHRLWATPGDAPAPAALIDEFVALYGEVAGRDAVAASRVV